ncbi:hypothetical protein ASD25_04720 [Brevundimonas sp. Root1423]|nr:hypothetical protein ASD25_04720 [Brevundimonas sp. Root1423]
MSLDFIGETVDLSMSQQRSPCGQADLLAVKWAVNSQFVAQDDGECACTGWHSADVVLEAAAVIHKDRSGLAFGHSHASEPY